MKIPRKELNGIRGRLKRFDECIAILKNIRDNIPEAEYLKNPFYYSTGERNLHLAIEILLDISDLIIARAGFRQPGSYSDVIQVLREENVLPEDFAKKVEKLPGFRNLLVHEYLKVDHKLVYGKIKTGLDDLEMFAQYLTRFLKV